MRIGIDFDNTIVSYDTLFYKVAREQGLVPESIAATKLAVRDHLRRAGKEDRWTEMQGYVYGARMDEATSYPGVLEFFRAAISAGHDLAIISHKTRNPFLGPQYDLHAAAREWIMQHLVFDGAPLLPVQQVYFELTKEEKLGRVAAFGCEVFIDDLPEILTAPAFPKQTRAMLFDPDGHHHSTDLPVFRSWHGIAAHLGFA